MSRKEEKWIKRLEILGASTAAIVIVSAVGTFLLDSIAMQLMALAVGCGSIVNVVLMVLCYYKKKTIPSIIFMIFALLLIATFIMQIMAKNARVDIKVERKLHDMRIVECYVPVAHV